MFRCSELTKSFQWAVEQLTTVWIAAYRRQNIIENKITRLSGEAVEVLLYGGVRAKRPRHISVEKIPA